MVLLHNHSLRLQSQHRAASPSAAGLDFLIKFLGANELRQIDRRRAAEFVDFDDPGWQPCVSAIGTDHDDVEFD
jgi:hypothetical protein